MVIAAPAGLVTHDELITVVERNVEAFVKANMAEEMGRHNNSPDAHPDIRRALEDLPKDGRPLSQTGNLEEMYCVRGPLYTGAADISVWNDKAPEETAAEIWREFSAYPGN